METKKNVDIQIGFLKKTLERFENLDKANLLMLSGAYIIFIALMILSHFHYFKTDYNVGDTAEQSVIADFTYPYFDQNDFQNSLNLLEASEPYYYNADSTAASDFTNAVRELDSILQSDSQEAFIAAIQKKGYAFSDEVWEYLIGNRYVIALYQNRFLRIYSQITEDMVVVDEEPDEGVDAEIFISTAEEEISASLSDIKLYPLEKRYLVYEIDNLYDDFDSDFESAMAEILINLIQPTAFIDSQRRQANLQELLIEQRLQKIVREGEVIIKKGDTLTSDSISRLNALKTNLQEKYKKALLSKILLSTALFFLLVFLIFHNDRAAFVRHRNIAVALSAFVLSITFYYFVSLFRWAVAVPSFLLIPFGFICIILPELIRESKAPALILLGYALFFLFFPAFDLTSFFNLVFLSLFTLLTTKRLQNRQDFFILGLILSLIQLLFGAEYIRSLTDFSEFSGLTIVALTAFINGMLSSMLSLGLLPLMEYVLNVPTRFRLLELASPTTSELLKELRREAPGTYNHSILIGDMSEEAAEAIGIDGLLVKVGGYYHDIGKSDNPDYFVENQSAENKHDKIRPGLSVSIIKNHVKVGMEMAKKARLPQAVADFITGHHGTTTISYFYHQAMGLFGDGNVNLEDYAYPGPKPQTKGIAIVMLADGIEATVRAYSQNNENFNAKNIMDIIDDSVERRMQEGQLDECDLTLQELKIIKLSFLKHLTAYYHKRIDYQKSRNAKSAS